MSEQQKKRLMELWNFLTREIHALSTDKSSAKIDGEKRLYEKKLRDKTAERTGVEAAVLTLGYCFIKDKNENATGIEKLGCEERMCWMK